jgi:hypothetical protein
LHLIRSTLSLRARREVVAHSQCATLRVGDVFLKVDGDPTHADVEVRAMAMAPIPTPAILWRESVGLDYWI